MTTTQTDPTRGETSTADADTREAAWRGVGYSGSGGRETVDATTTTADEVISTMRGGAQIKAERLKKKDCDGTATEVMKNNLRYNMWKINILQSLGSEFAAGMKPAEDIGKILRKRASKLDSGNYRNSDSTVELIDWLRRLADDADGVMVAYAEQDHSGKTNAVMDARKKVESVLEKSQPSAKEEGVISGQAAIEAARNQVQQRMDRTIETINDTRSPKDAKKSIDVVMHDSAESFQLDILNGIDPNGDIIKQLEEKKAEYDKKAAQPDKPKGIFSRRDRMPESAIALNNARYVSQLIDIVRKTANE